MISFTDEQIKQLSKISRNLDYYDKDVFGEILDDNGKKSGLELNFLDVHHRNSGADVVVTINRSEIGSQSYNLRDLRFDIDLVLGVLKKFGIEQFRVVLAFNEIKFTDEDGPKYLRSDFTLGELSEMEYYVKERYNGNVYYSEYFPAEKSAYGIEKWLQEGSLWSFDQVKKANLAIEKITKFIETEKLSPLEAIAFVSAFAYKNFSYFFHDTEVNYELTNTIVAAINRKKITCVGYAQFFESIVDGLWEYYVKKDNYMISEDISIITRQSSHAVSKVYIKDKKYNLNGKFLVDINNVVINFLNRPITDWSGYKDHAETATLSGGCVKIHKDINGKISIQDENSKTLKISEFIRRYNEDTIIATASAMKGWRYVKSSQNQAEIFKQDRVEISGGRRGSPLSSLRLSRMPRKKLNSLLNEAYANIADVKIPTVEELIAEKEEEFTR